MKKLLAMLLSAVMVLGLLACSVEPGNQTVGTTAGSVEETTAATEPAATENKNGLLTFPTGQFLAGYDRQCITPEAPVPLGGYGNTSRRIHTTVSSDIYATCVALTDPQGETVIYIEWDSVRAYENVVPTLRDVLAQSIGIPKERIMIASSHSHCCPDMSNSGIDTIPAYLQLVIKQTVTAVKNALNDRKPAELYVGSVEATGLNFVKHYQHTLPDGTVKFFGDNFGTAVYDETTTHTTQSDPTMHLMQIKREGGKEIVLANWRAHPQLEGGSSKTVLSADYVGAFRTALELQYDCNFVYFQGAAGNQNPKSRLSEENLTTDVNAYGAKLAEYALEGLSANMRKVEVDRIQNRNMTYVGTVDHSWDGKVTQAKLIASKWSATASIEEVRPMLKEYGFNSPYHANAVNRKAGLGESFELELNAFLLGDEVAIVTAPNELFDTNSVWLEENSPTTMTFTFGYANGHQFYIPSAYAFEHGCYEADNCTFVAGTAEDIQNNFLSMINEMYGA